jgi:hypothetical protein
MKALKTVAERVSRISRHVDFNEIDNMDISHSVDQLRTQGYTVLTHLIGGQTLKNLQAKISHKIEVEHDIEYPCLAQKKIGVNKDSDLIDKSFLVKNSDLKSRGLTFERNDVVSYEQMLKRFNPSTIKVAMPSDPEFYEIWLDPKVMGIVANYMGFYPQLTEAYIRRNFPCTFPVMNHNWHRDKNHDEHLLKAFIFFTDCDSDTGAHHYISGSVNDERFRDKTYYTEEDISEIWPQDSNQRMVSNVKAGTIIIEDTRGLHKAGIPKRDYRDLGFAVFLPPNIFRRSAPFYNINRSTVSRLTNEQRRFIPMSNVVDG